MTPSEQPAFAACADPVALLEAPLKFGVIELSAGSVMLCSASCGVRTLQQSRAHRARTKARRRLRKDHGRRLNEKSIPTSLR
jgi:hypothetical protein